MSQTHQTLRLPCFMLSQSLVFVHVVKQCLCSLFHLMNSAVFTNKSSSTKTLFAHQSVLSLMGHC